MLLFIIAFEVAESYLAVNITPDENISISPLQITYAWMSFVSVVALIAFIRLCEIYDKAGEWVRERGTETVTTLNIMHSEDIINFA